MECGGGIDRGKGKEGKALYRLPSLPYTSLHFPTMRLGNWGKFERLRGESGESGQSGD